MIQGSITIVENTDAIPQLGIILGGGVREARGGEEDSIDSYLGGRKQIESLLISGVCPLQIITHEITVAYEMRVTRTRERFVNGGKNEPRELHTSPLSPCKSTTRWK